MTRPGLHALVAALCTAVGAIALWLKGPMPVVAVSYAKSHTAPFLYMVSAFPFYGALWGEALWRWRHGEPHRVFVAQLLVVGALSAARLVFQVPISGHVLLQVFFCCAVLDLPRGTVRRVELLVGLAVLVALLWTKLFAWADFVTPSAAVVAALLVVLAGKRVKPRS